MGENGGIHGHVVYASTRPFDDPQLLLQTSWMPLVPNVTINLYKENTAPDGSKLPEYVELSSFLPKAMLNVISIVALVNSWRASPKPA